MSTAPLAARSANPWGSRASTRRALALLRGGLVGAHVLGLPVVGLTLALRGATAAGWAAVAMAVILVFNVVGQSVQVVVAERDPVTVMGASMGSYTLRAVGLGLLLWLATKHPLAVETFAKGPVFIASMATIVGWIAGEIWTFQRFDFPVYDREYVPPRGGSGGAGDPQ